MQFKKNLKIIILIFIILFSFLSTVIVKAVYNENYPLPSGDNYDGLNPTVENNINYGFASITDLAKRFPNSKCCYLTATGYSDKGSYIGSISPDVCWHESFKECINIDLNQLPPNPLPTPYREIVGVFGSGTSHVYYPLDGMAYSSHYGLCSDFVKKINSVKNTDFGSSQDHFYNGNEPVSCKYIDNTVAQEAAAQAAIDAYKSKPDLEFSPNVAIPGSEFKLGSSISVSSQAGKSDLLARYIQALYKFLIGIAAILAVIMIAYGGFLWLFASGSGDKISKAKEVIIAAISGLLLALGSYLLLNFINPNLVTFQGLGVKKIDQISLKADWCKNVVLAPGKDNGFTPCVMGSILNDQFNPPPTDKDGKYICGGTLVKQDETACGIRYLIPNTSSSAYCFGTAIGPELQDVPSVGCFYDTATRETVPWPCDGLTVEDNQVTKTDLGNRIVFNPFSLIKGASPDSICSQSFKFDSPFKFCGYTNDNNVNAQGGCAFYQIDCNKIKSCQDYDNIEVTSNRKINLSSRNLLLTWHPLALVAAMYSEAIDWKNFVLGPSAKLNKVENIMKNVCPMNVCGIAGGCKTANKNTECVSANVK